MDLTDEELKKFNLLQAEINTKYATIFAKLKETKAQLEEAKSQLEKTKAEIDEQDDYIYSLENEPCPIYKVNVLDLAIGMRIESFSCESLHFLEEIEAMDFAYELAKEYVLDNDRMPCGYDDYDELDSKEKVKILKKSTYYKWPNSDYSGWNDYSIKVEKDVIDYSKKIINKTRFSEDD